MNPQTRIEESHGLWEMAVVRLAALVEAGAKRPVVQKALAEERIAFWHWREVSVRAILESEKKP